MTVATIEPTGQQPAEPDDNRPRDEPAERAMLAAVLWTAQQDTAAAHALVDELGVLVEPRDMWVPAHEAIWQAMVEATAEGLPLHPAAIDARLRRSASGRQAAGEVPRLATLQTPAGSAVHDAKAVQRAAHARAVIQVGMQAAARGYDPAFDPTVDVPEVVGLLERIGAGNASAAMIAMPDLVEHAVDLIEKPEKIDVIPSGLYELDMLYPGMTPGQLVVVGARPAVGKSVYAVTLAREAAIRLQYRTLLFSLEMSALDVMARLIAAHATVDLGKILTGKVEEGDWSKIARHQQTIADAPLLIDDTSDVTMAHIRATVRKEARRGLRLVIIDYLQLITVTRAESRQTGIDEIARQLKVLARETGVPFLVLSQLNRGPEQRADKRPMLSDLRESGGLENHPDVVVLIHRPDLYDKDARPGEADLIVAKHRQGRTGAAPVAFQGHYARFAPMTGWDQKW